MQTTPLTRTSSFASSGSAVSLHSESDTSASSFEEATNTSLCALTSSNALQHPKFLLHLCVKGLVGVLVKQTTTVSAMDAPNVLAEAVRAFGCSTSSWRQATELLDGRECTYLTSYRDMSSKDLPCLPKGEPLTDAQVLRALSNAGLRSVIRMPFTGGALYIIESPAITFPSLSAAQHSLGVPLRADWDRLWAAWDLVTLRMIPEHMLLQKPIDLRHLCLFYIGHIPTFLDMLLSKAIGGEPSEPAHFWNIFERGIDPHVDDPDHCHAHSDIPESDEDWPSLTSILGFRTRVRARLMNLYKELEGGERKMTRNIARTIAFCLEHEGFHIETLLYMLIQRAGTGTRSPPGFTAPPWALLAAQWDAASLPSSPTVTIEAQTVVIGHDDSEADDATTDFMPEHEMGWDNESPSRSVHVNRFQVSWRPITNGEFLFYLNGKGKGVVGVPKSWVEESGDYMVRTMYGPVPMAIAQLWPVLTDYDDLKAYAASKGGRLPTEPELKLFLDKYEVGHEGGANVGFRNWHPVPATTGDELDGGRGGNGGVWEWTETLFETHEGMVPTNLFPGYSTDFFDTKHNVVLGASYATIPRIGGRVRNFWQRMYPYAWCGARVVYDEAR